jgi:hypothetical protein
MSFEKLNLISKSFEYWYFFRSSDKKGILIPFFDDTPKKAQYRKDFFSKKGKIKRRNVKNGNEKR